MLLLVAAVMTGLGVIFGYVAVGMARTQERALGYEECEKRLEILRRQLRRRAH
jgi:hypothetical protein